jgi:hypothetical protein
MKTLAATFLLLTAWATAQQSSESPASKPAVIRGSGCIAKAVETSCLVLKDSKTGELYNLFFVDQDRAPASGTAIRFQATEHQGMTTCMQGKAVNVSKWKTLKDAKCPAEPEPQH